MSEVHVRNEVVVGALLHLHTAVNASAAVTSEAVGARSGGRLHGTAGGRVIAMRVCCVRRVDWLRCIEYSFVYINEREACRPGVAYSDIQRLSGCTTARDVPLATLDVVWGCGGMASTNR